MDHRCAVADLTLQQLVFRLFAFVVIAGVHGLAVAATAYALGDPGPKYDGRLRASPLAHLDLLGALSGVLFSVGWIKPLAIDPVKMRSGRLGLVVVVIAGAVASLLSVVVLRLMRPHLLPLLPDTASQILFNFVETFGQMSLVFALVNVLPIPCLTGGHLLTVIVPTARDALERSRPYAALLLALCAGAISLRVTALPSGIANLWEGVYRMLAGNILGE
jgi:Zn-dependent protease